MWPSMSPRREGGAGGLARPAETARNRLSYRRDPPRSASLRATSRSRLTPLLHRPASSPCRSGVSRDRGRAESSCPTPSIEVVKHPPHQPDAASPDRRRVVQECGRGLRRSYPRATQARGRSGASRGHGTRRKRRSSVIARSAQTLVARNSRPNRKRARRPVSFHHWLAAKISSSRDLHADRRCRPPRPRRWSRRAGSPGDARRPRGRRRRSPACPSGCAGTRSGRARWNAGRARR